MGTISITSHKDVTHTSSASNINQITEDYYYHLVGEINRGTVVKAVCRIYYPRFNYTTYHLLS